MAPVPASINLVDRLRGAFSPAMILEASASVRADPRRTQQALEGLVPAILLAVLRRYEGPSLLGLLVNPNAPAEPAVLLGEHSAEMAEWVVREIGITRESANSLLSLATPRIVDALRRLQSERNLGSSALEAVLVAHRARIGRLLPEGLHRALSDWP